MVRIGRSISRDDKKKKKRRKIESSRKTASKNLRKNTNGGGTEARMKPTIQHMRRSRMYKIQIGRNREMEINKNKVYRTNTRHRNGPCCLCYNRRVSTSKP